MFRMNELKDFLQKIGLSEKESSVYLYLLSVTSSGIAPIAKNTEVNRTTIYPIIKSLLENKFIEEKQEKGKPVFHAITPDRIYSYLQEQKIKIEEQSNYAKDMIPRLKAIAREDGIPIVEYKPGKEAIIQNTQNFSPDENNPKIYLIYSRDQIESTFSQKEIATARNTRLVKDIDIETLYTYSKGEYSPNTNSKRLRIDEKKYPIKCELRISGENLFIHTFGNRIGSLHIRNKDVADTMITLFNLAVKSHTEEKI